jgi:truncated hemoglobin YjbI
MSLFEKYGGERFWGPVFVSFLDTLRREEQLSHYFTGVDIATLGRSMLLLFQQALGFDPGHFPISIRRIHTHMHIQQQDFSRFLEIFEETIKRNGVEQEDGEEIAEVLLAFQRDVVERK